MGKGTDKQKPIKNRKALSIVLDILLITAIVVLAGFVGVMIVRNTYFETFYVNGQSMYPYLNYDACDDNGIRFGKNGGNLSVSNAHNIDYGLMDCHEYTINNLKRFDIAVWNVSTDPDTQSLLIKRVIGLPGETIKFNSDGELFIKQSSGEFTLVEQPIEPEYLVDAYDESEIILGSDEYYLCGDNRGHSEDSRGKYKIAKRNKIIGKAVMLIGHCTLKKTLDGSYNVKDISYSWPRFI